MKKYFLQVIGVVTSLLMITNPVMASTSYSQTECEQLAEAIANGSRSPLTRDELEKLDEQTISRLTADLEARHTQSHQEHSKLANRQDQLQQSNTNRADPSNEENLEKQNSESPQPQSLSKSEQDFIKLICHDAQQVALENDLFASVMIAQAVLESDWGRSDLARAHNNLFGIKGIYYGQSTTLPTQEHHNGQTVTELGTFRKYPTIKESLADYAKVLDQEMYAGVHKRNCDNYKIATQVLSCNYATDPHYQHKLNHLIEAYNLTQYDQSPLSDKQSIKGQSRGSHHSAPRETLPKKKSPKRKGIILPLIGGISSVSLVELIKRYLK